MRPRAARRGAPAGLRPGVAWIWWIIAIGAFACRTGGVAGVSKVDADVWDALRRDGLAHVIVALTPRGGAEAAGVPRDSTDTSAIAALQDSVLGDLDPADYRGRQRFRNVPAMSGTVLTERGLRVLAEHPLVKGVSLDRGGGGAMPP